jgi:uncharacterized DUF497 family protein
VKYSVSEHAKLVIEERGINISDIEQVLKDPQLKIPDAKDLEIEHRLGVIQKNENRILRVIINKDRKPIHIVTAFYDRSMKGKL